MTIVYLSLLAFSELLSNMSTVSLFADNHQTDMNSCLAVRVFSRSAFLHPALLQRLAIKPDLLLSYNMFVKRPLHLVGNNERIKLSREKQVEALIIYLVF